MKRYKFTGHALLECDTGEWVPASDALAEKDRADKLQNIIHASGASNYAAAEIQWAGLHNSLRRAESEIAELRARLVQTEEDRQHYATKYADMLALYDAALAECEMRRNGYTAIAEQLAHEEARARAGVAK
jgi:septal ring factor EnvC (AmiA/AmiB activator)